MELLQPVYLGFWLPMAAATAYILLMVFGLTGMEHHDVDISHDVHIHGDVDPGHHIEAGHDVHVGHGDVHHGHDVGHHLGLVGRALALLGVGRVPISVLMISLCILFGASGILMLGVLDFAPAKAYLGAAVVALTGTGLLSELLASLIPKEESYYCLPEELVGGQAEVLYTVGKDAGMVRILDPCGNLRDLPARMRSTTEIPSGTTVVLTDYDAGAAMFYVETA